MHVRRRVRAVQSASQRAGGTREPNGAGLRDSVDNDFEIGADNEHNGSPPVGNDARRWRNDVTVTK